MKKIRLLSLVLVLILALAGCASSPETADDAGTAENSGRQEGLAFPLVLEEGRLTVESVFQYSGMNPDCGNESGEDVAALEVKNTSVLHLSRAELTLTLDDGTKADFLVEDLPAGETVRVFAQDNTPMAAGSGEGIGCRAEFTEEAPVLADKVRVETDGMHLQVTNVSEEDLENIKVYCHSMLEGASFGGRTYCYTVNHISAGETASAEAADCYLDGALVVRIEG